MRFIQKFSFFICFIWLAGCATTSESTKDQPKPSTATKQATPKEVVSRPFQDDSLYALLVAEFALQRGHYDIALGNYLLQAHKTNDAGVAERATHIAQYLSADQAAQEAAALWVKLDDKNIQAHQALAREYVLTKQLRKALVHIEAIEQLGGSPNYYLAAIEAKSLPQTEITQILEAYFALHAKYPDNLQIALSIAYLNKLLKSQETALTQVNSVLDKDDRYVSAILLKAQILAEMNQRDAAQSFLKDALKQDFKAANEQSISKLYLVMLLQKPTAPNANAFISETTDKFEQDSAYLLTIAQICAENDAFPQAEMIFKMLATDPKHASISHFYLGLFAEKKQQYAQAIYHYRQVTDNKNLISAYSRALNILVQQNEIDAALTLASQGTRQFPRFEIEFALLTFDIYKRSEQPKKALSSITEAIDKFPDYTDLRYTRAMYAVEQQDLALAEADLKHIIEKEPQNASALNALGYTLADQTNRIDEAKILIEKAYAINSEDPAIIDSLGWVYFKQGDIKKALSLLQQAYQKYPDPEIAVHLAEALWVNEQHDEARQFYQKILKEYPDHKLTQELQLRIPELNP